MTAVETLDEEELLNGSALLLDNLDEDALLGPISRTNTTDFDIDNAEQELLGEDAVQYEVPTCPDASFDKEELDYDEDEDEDKEERVGRFTSERTKQATASSTVPNKANSSNQTHKKGDENKKNWNNNRGGAFNNRGRSNQWNNRGGSMGMRGRGPMMNNFGGPPSLLTMQMEPPIMLNQNGGKILINPNFAAPLHPPHPQPLVRLNLPGAPPISLGSSAVPSMPIGSNSVGPIVPRLPNGIPLVPIPNLPPNHGMAGFGNNLINRHYGSSNSSAYSGGWDQKVEEFINSGLRKPKRRSSSYSSRSNSSSYSGSSKSRSRSRSRSRSPRKHHRSDKRYRHEKDSRRNGERNLRGRRGGRGGPGSRRYDRSDRSRKDERGEVAAECAKVVGVDKDYLTKVEEQKRLREEMLRMKEQRRHGADEKPRAEISEGKRVQNSKLQMNSEVNSNAGSAKKKAFLCVNVKNLKQLPTALNRVEGLAREFGNVKKVWKFNDDQVNIIFTELEKAKAFMLKYNNKVLSGLRIQVTLEKAYLSLAEVQG